MITNRLVESSKAHGMEINQEKSKTMVNSKKYVQITFTWMECY